MECILVPVEDQLESLWSMFPDLKPKTKDEVLVILQVIQDRTTTEIEDFPYMEVADKIMIKFDNEEESVDELKIKLKIRVVQKLHRPSNKRAKVNLEELGEEHFAPFEPVTLDPTRQCPIPETTGPRTSFKFRIIGGSILKAKKGRRLNDFIDEPAN